MSDDETKILNKKRRPYEEKVLAELESVRSDLRTLSKTVERYLDTFSRKLDVINSELLSVKADQRDVEDRVSKIEAETRPQVIPQEKEF
jgi:hypothetical protein